MKKITIIVPVFNEEAALPIFYVELKKIISPLVDYDFEILFVDDGSNDASACVLEALHTADKAVSVVTFSRNFGKEAAMLAGLDEAQGDAVIIMDADLQDPPSLIPEMLRLWEEGYDDIYGRRRSREKHNGVRIGARIYHRFLASLADIDLRGDVGDFRLLDSRCVSAIRSMRETQRYTKGMFAWIGFKKYPLDYDVPLRSVGKSKWTLPKLIGLALDGITSHSVVPLRLASYVGFIVSIIAFIYLLAVVIKAFFDGDKVAGYPSLMAVMLFLGGFILLGIGIIGEYLGRIFLETKCRPVYVIDFKRSHISSDHNTQKNEPEKDNKRQ